MNTSTTKETRSISWQWAILFLLIAVIIWPPLALLDALASLGRGADNLIDWIERSRLPDFISFVRNRIHGKEVA